MTRVWIVEGQVDVGDGYFEYVPVAGMMTTNYRCACRELKKFRTQFPELKWWQSRISEYKRVPRGRMEVSCG